MSVNLSNDQKKLVEKWETFYKSLKDGSRKPETEAQKHFVKVMNGYAKAETDHEKAYLNFLHNEEDNFKKLMEEIEIPPGQRLYPPGIGESHYDPADKYRNDSGRY